jgi:dihydrolipoamide dehydrogenase
VIVTAPQTYAENGGKKKEKVAEIEAKHIILATGARARQLPGLETDGKLLWSYREAMLPDVMPKSILVIGSGAIGIEFASFYNALGVDVTVVEVQNRILPVEDEEISKFAQKSFEAQGMKFRIGTGVKSVTKGKNNVIAHLEKDGKKEDITVDRVIVAVGIVGNTEGLGLEGTKVKVERGQIMVDDMLRTGEPGVYAIGDVAGEPMLAHKATREAKVVAEVLAGEPAAFDPVAIPAVVFTDPEVAWCGVTEAQAKQENLEVKVVRFPWAASGRAQSLARTEGLTKLICDAKTDRVLGVGIVGAGAGELISEAVIAVEMAAVARDLADSIHPHPTLSETLMEGAEAIIGQATHMYRPVRK